jgi:hypothetical protein
MRKRFSRSRLKKGEVFSRFIFKVSRLKNAKRKNAKRENYRPVTVTSVTKRYRTFQSVTYFILQKTLNGLF